MKIEDERRILARCGDDVRVEADCSSDGQPEVVRIEYKDRETDKWISVAPKLPASVLERAAEAVRQLRYRIGDDDHVCPDHGYYGHVVFTPDGDEQEQGECPTCAEQRKADDSVRRLASKETT